ncbi:MAG: O-antigen ligase family protein [Candidatus Parcubacteria bacterium]|nr:O-antigen ligase family protein [Candidatus Parcubacteria bacterium]
MDKSLKTIRYFILGGLFLTPFLVLIISSSLFFPFITGKNFTFRILIEIIFCLWLILLIFDRNYRPQKSWILIAFTSFLVFLALSSVFGENFYRSFWSNYERMEGLITYLHLFAFFLILISVMKENLWKWFFNTSLAASVIVGIYGFLQMVGKLPIHQGGVRLDATLGNATYLAVYMVFHIFLAAVMFFKNKEWYRWFYLPVAVLNLIILYHTATRGAILGLIGGFILAFILSAIFYPSKRVKIFSASLLGLIIILIVVFLFFKDSQFIKQSPVLSRFSSISFQETTTQSRLVIWKMSWQGFKEKPILGWGPENFNLVFNKYYEPILWKQEPWFDRAHNVFLDRLTAGGFLGLLAYLSLFFFALYYLWKKTSSITESIIMTSMFAAYFFHNLFVFDNFISSLLFIIFLAYISSKAQEAKLPLGSVASKYPTNLGLKSASALIIVISTIFIVYYVNVPGILAAQDLIKALGFSSKGDFQSSFSTFQKAISRNSFGTGETREQLSSFTQQVLSVPGLDNNFKQKVFDFTVSEIKKQSNQSPNDIRYMIFLGVIYNKAGQYDEAIDIFQRAIKLSPKKQQIYFELGVSYLNKKEYDKGLEVLKEAFEFDQEFFEARKIYAVAAIFAGKDGLAEELMKNYGGTIITDERFLQAFNKRKMFDKVAAIWEKFIENNPKNAQYRVSLAAGYLQMGERQKAIEQLQKAIELEPRFKQQGEYYIKEIQAGRNP